MSRAVLTITDEARGEGARGPRRASPSRTTLALWVEVSGEQAGAYTYDMSSGRVDDAGDDDVVQHHDDLLGRHPDATASSSSAAPTLDFRRRHGDAEPEPARCRAGCRDRDRPTADLSGDVAAAGASQVLEEQINPAIAAHGGRAELVAVEDPSPTCGSRAGARAAAWPSVTLSQGIEVAILDAVPEITEVVDVTDHASGVEPVLRGRQEVARADTRRSEAAGVLGGVAARPRCRRPRCARIDVDDLGELRRGDRARHLGRRHAGAHAAERAAHARGGLALLLGDRDDVALRLALDAQARHRVGEHHQLLAGEAQEHDVGIDRASRRAGRR